MISFSWIQFIYFVGLMVMSMVKYDAVVKVKQKSIQDLSTLDIVKAFTVIKLVSVQITMQQPGC